VKTASAIILAGGNGERLRPLTRRLVASRTRDSSPMIFRAMSWKGIPSGSRCFRSPAPPGRTWATPCGRSPQARWSSVSSDAGARGTTAFR